MSIGRHLSLRRRILLLVLLTTLGPLGWPGPARGMDEADRLWLVGERAFQDGLPTVARRALERLVDRFPGDQRVAQALLLVGKARLAGGALEPALQAFRRAQEFSPPPGAPEEARFWEAETLLRLQRFAEARALYDRILAETPTTPLAADALYGLAWTNIELKLREQAVSDLRRFVTAYPEHAAGPSATYYLARTLVELQQPEPALPLLRGFVEKYREHRLLPQARYLLGEALRAAGQGSEAMAELRAFLRAHPRHDLAGPARRALVDVVLRLGKKEEMLAEYRELEAQSPPTPDGLYDAGTLASRLGRPRDAAAAWARLRKQFPDHPLAARAALDLGHAAFGRGAFKDAVGLARAAAKATEDGLRAEAWLLVGESELKLRRFKEAHQAFESVVETPGIEAAVRYRALAGSGLVMEETKAWKEAAEYYDQVVAGSPDETLQAWARQRREAVAAKLKPAPPAEPPSQPKAAPRSKARPAGGRG